MEVDHVAYIMVAKRKSAGGGPIMYNYADSLVPSYKNYYLSRFAL